ncbi:MAG: glycosyltransferase family 39 protein [bacterium]
MVSLEKIFLISPLIQINTVDWVERSARFYTNLLSGNYIDTFQKYHPGVTLMWVVGFCEKVYRKFNYYEDTVLNYRSFPNFIFLTGLVLLFIYCLSLFLSFLILKKHFGKLFAFFVCFFMLFEPFLFGFTYSVSPDSLVVAFSFLTLVLIFDSFYGTENKWSKYIFVGVSAGFLVLTKITLLIIFPVILFYSILNKAIKNKLVGILGVLITALLTFIIFFPAMWVNPIDTVLKIFRDGLIDAPLRDYSGPIISNWVSGNIFIKKFLSYPIYYIFRISPFGFMFSILGLLVFFKKFFTKSLKSFVWLISIFLLVYFLSIALPNKQIYKYVLPLFIGNAVFSALGIVFLVRTFKKHSFKTVLISSIIFLQLIYFWFSFPKFLLTYNPLVGGSSVASYFLVPDFESTGFYEASLYINAKNLPDTITIATYPNKSLEPLTNLTVLDGRVSKNADYSLVPYLYRYPYGKLLDISTGCFLPEKEFIYRGKEYLVLYRNVCK